MEKFPKVRFIIITILVITLVNIIALGIILRTSFHDHRKEMQHNNKDFANRGFQFLKEQLELTPDQEVVFKSDRDSFFASINILFDDLEKKRIDMIQELGREKPDTAVLYQIADSMGNIHGKLKHQVVDHMLKLKSYCTPKQVVKLDSLYKILIRTESPWRKKHNLNEGPPNEKQTDKKVR